MLKPCPFCDSPRVAMVKMGDYSLRVTCQMCGALGPHTQKPALMKSAEYEDMVAFKWNRR